MAMVMAGNTPLAVLQETCLILPRCKLALDIGRCPQQAVYQQTVLITHGHLDHIGGVTFHSSSRCAV
jgi:ribonuclease Z